MTINAISTNTTTAVSATHPSAEARQLLEAKQAERPAALDQERLRRQDETPQPVVNAQGQPTGTLINVVA